MTFRSEHERILVTRTTSATVPNIVTDPTHGKHTLFHTFNGLKTFHLRTRFGTTLLEVSRTTDSHSPLTCTADHAQSLHLQYPRYRLLQAEFKLVHGSSIIIGRRKCKI